MRSVVAALAATVMLAATAGAQTPAGSGGRSTYVEGLVQSAFGNVTSQSFGAEVGMAVTPRLRVFVELGRARDTAPETLGQNAQIIAGYLTQVQSAPVGFSVRQPVTFGMGGVRYVIPYDEDFEPYLVGGVGLARVERNVRFSVDGSDVTESLGTFGVALGRDLGGNSTKPMVALGGGVVYYFSETLFLDLQVRFGRIFTDDEATNLSRAGIGVGIRF